MSTANLVQRFGLTALIGAAVAGAATILGLETEWGQRSNSPVIPRVAAAKPDEIRLLPPFALPPIDPTFKESVERPLFSFSRRPIPPATAPAAVAAVAQKGQFRLVGTSVSSDAAIALLLDNKTGKTLRAKKGDEVRPGDSTIRVDQVTPTRVVLRHGAETEELGLRTASSPPGAAAPPAALRPGAGGTAQGGAPQIAGSAQGALGGSAPNPGGAQSGFPTPTGFAGGFPVPSAQGGAIPLPPGVGGTPMPLPPGVQVPFPPGVPQSGLAVPGAGDQPAAGIDPAMQRRRRFQTQLPSQPQKPPL